jgi:DNA-binding NarL/FixJ family response regulator
MSAVSVLVYSDQRMFCSTLAASLDDGVHDVAGAVECLEDLQRAVRTAEPDVCVLDARTGTGAGNESDSGMFAAVREACPDTHLLVLTTGDDRAVWEAYDVGLVDAMISKVHGLAAVRTAIDRAALGERFALAAARSSAVPRTVRVSLTAREREILLLLAHGATTQHIRTTLRISSNTLRTHIQHVLNKLHAHTRAQAVQAALTAGLLVELDEEVS